MGSGNEQSHAESKERGKAAGEIFMGEGAWEGATATLSGRLIQKSLSSESNG